jgi:hypothetical protein
MSKGRLPEKRVKLSYVLLALAASLLAFGLTKLLAQLFLAQWELSSAGHPDIAARGVWLLTWILPQMAGFTALVSAGIVLALTRQTGRAWPGRLTSGLIGSLVGAGLIVVGADPTALGLRDLQWESALTYHVVSSVVAIAIVLAGVLAIRKMAAALRR